MLGFLQAKPVLLQVKGIPFLVFDAGGVLEMFDSKEFSDNVVFEPTLAALKRKLSSVVRLPSGRSLPTSHSQSSHLGCNCCPCQRIAGPSVTSPDLLRRLDMAGVLCLQNCCSAPLKCRICCQPSNRPVQARCWLACGLHAVY